MEELTNIKAVIDVYYKTVDDKLKLPMQVFLPKDFEETKKYPTVIAIHGGGWESLAETPADWDGGWMANNAKYYAQKGYVGIVFSYRHVAYHGYGDIGLLIEDCQDALGYIAKEFSFVDKSDIMLMGDSAGGHLALCLAMGIPDRREPALNIKKVAAYNPVTNCILERWRYISTEPEKFSLLHNIRKVDADILVMHGTADVVVDIDDSRNFTALMKDAGNEISMIEIPDAKHAFILFGYESEDADVVRALGLTDNYFAKK